MEEKNGDRRKNSAKQEDADLGAARPPTVGGQRWWVVGVVSGSWSSDFGG
jgi:hypothetical protein